MSRSAEMEAALQHDVNVTRRIRTEEYARKLVNYKDAIKDPSFSYRSEMITTSLYCACKDCIKFCCYKKPIKCIDPYLMDMRYTHWIYHGLVAAGKTASTRVDTTDTAPTASTSSEEPKEKRRKR